MVISVGYTDVLGDSFYVLHASSIMICLKDMHASILYIYKSCYSTRHYLVAGVVVFLTLQYCLTCKIVQQF